jgi:hypothetical protein
MTIKMGRLINELLTGKRLVKTEASWAPLIFCQGLTGNQKILAELQYEEAYDEAIEMEIPTEKELKIDLHRNAVWTFAQDKILKECTENVKTLKKQLEPARYKRARFKALEKRVKKATEKRDKLFSYKHALFSNSAERYAEEQKIWWGIHKMAFHTNGDPIWQDYEDFANFDIDEVTKIVNAHLLGFRLPIEDVRRVARNGEWRIYYNSCKDSSNLFNRALSDLDDNQLNVLYWSVIYDNALNAYEPPGDDVFDDDDLFDGWLDAQARQRRKDRAKSRHSKGGGGGDLHESFVMTDEEGATMLYDEIGPQIHDKR